MASGRIKHHADCGGKRAAGDHSPLLWAVQKEECYENTKGGGTGAALDVGLGVTAGKNCAEEVRV